MSKYLLVDDSVAKLYLMDTLEMENIFAQQGIKLPEEKVLPQESQTLLSTETICACAPSVDSNVDNSLQTSPYETEHHVEHIHDNIKRLRAEIFHSPTCQKNKHNFRTKKKN